MNSIHNLYLIIFIKHYLSYNILNSSSQMKNLKWLSNIKSSVFLWNNDHDFAELTSLCVHVQMITHTDSRVTTESKVIPSTV